MKNFIAVLVVAVWTLAMAGCPEPDAPDGLPGLSDKALGQQQESSPANGQVPTASTSKLTNAAGTPTPAAPPRHQLSVKRQLPFEAYTTVRGEVSAGDLVLEISIVTDRALNQLETTARGIDGVVITGAATVAHGSVARHATVTHRPQVRVGSAVAGYVAVDVEWVDADGRLQGGTTAIDLRARGAAYKMKKLGTLTTDENGQPVMMMKAQSNP